MERKLEKVIGKTQSPDKRVNLDHLETASDFSAQTNESELRTDENILDFKVEDAEFYLDNFT